MRDNDGMADDLDIRLLRRFVAAAEEQHFSRAASRLFIAQQALSRDVRRLEEQLRMRLFDRTTRQVVLTADGERLLDRVRPFLAAHDDLVRELRGPGERVVVDVVGEDTTPARVLTEARRREDGFEFYASFNASLATSMAQLLAGTLDVAFGNVAGLTVPEGVRHRVVVREPFALLVPTGHPLAGATAVRLADLRGLTICCRTGNHVTSEWEHAALRLLADAGAEPAVDHPYVRGTGETAHHVRDGEPPVLTVVSQPAIPHAVVRPVIDPVPVYPWSMVWRQDWSHLALVVLEQALDDLAAPSSGQ